MQFRRGALMRDAPLPLRHDAVRIAGSEVDVVQHQHHRLALTAQDVHHFVRDRQPRLRIQRRKGLVQQDEARAGRQRARNFDAAAFAA
ncbi:hypothetical protein G6F24_018645 [Rhizopus arrhizus]|nr:hypothetical protein G6F24_018645 [Rhizopus arrhizus]